jgi:dihydrofolate reductase
MRKEAGFTVIILDQIVSVDGWAARSDGEIDFFLEREDLVDSVGDADRISRVAAVPLGSQTYREFSDYWPMQDPELPVNRLPKHVLSRTLDHAPWGEMAAAHIEQGGAAEIARGLEQRYGGDIIVWGSLSVAKALLTARAVDEIWLRIVPVAIGGGRTFWPEQDIEFSAVEANAHPNGLTIARYQLEQHR